MIKFSDWILARESSAFTRLRKNATSGLMPPIPDAATHSRSTSVSKKKKKKKKKIKKKVNKSPVNKNIDVFVKAVEDLKKDAESLEKKIKNNIKESFDQESLKNLAWHVLSHEKEGPFNLNYGEDWHNKLIELLHSVGWSDYADNLELAKPSEEDKQYASQEIPNPFMQSASKLINYDSSKKANFRASSDLYHKICDEIIQKIDRIIQDENWWLDAIRKRY